MSRSSKVGRCRRHSPLSGVRLWGVAPMITGFVTLQILWEELDPNDGWTRITGKKANDGPQKVHSLSYKQRVTARPKCSCTIQAFGPLRDFQDGVRRIPR